MSQRDTIRQASIERRDFLKIVGAVGLTASGLSRLEAAAPEQADEPLAVLVDTTRCAGCRNCELVCAEANGLPEPALDDADLEVERTTSPDHWSVMNRYETSAGEVFVKRQCMHCLQPACVSACLTRAMHKTTEGAVTWEAGKCMGCRFCMISCPFDVPKFEYDSATPRIRKCTMCAERLARSELPACVAECPAEALAFGPRDRLLAEARRRIAEAPDDYVHEIYGEVQAGGTCWLYLAAVPFAELGFRTDLADRAYPELTKEFLYGVPVVLTLAPAFLLALSNATRREEHDDE